jgi:periplasmic divalent cation tolerance protein
MQNYYLDDEYSVIYITCPSLDEARNIATILVEEKLAACVSIIPEIISTYRWDNKIQAYSETQLMVKTKASLFSELSVRVKELHSATLPEIIEVSIIQATNEYKMWLHDETK